MKNCLPMLLLGLLVWWPEARADVIIDMTTIGNAGNTADSSTGLGSVNYDYQISTYEVTVAQYTEFLNAVAASDPYGLWSENMASDPLGASINRSGEDGSYTYTAVEGKENEPVRCVTFYDACRFCNWMANGQESGDTETGSYDLSLGVDITRSSGATWVLPSEDEWYKAAYYDPETDSYYDYPNGSDEMPEEPTDGTTTREMNFGDYPYWEEDGSWVYYTDVGETTGQSPYGVYDMGGNVREWTDSVAWPSVNRISRGGCLYDSASAMSATSDQPYDPSAEDHLHGLRVAFLIPETSTIVLLFSGIPLALTACMRSRRVSQSSKT